MLSLVCVVATLAVVSGQNTRIIGGEETTIDQYPFAAVILRTDDSVTFTQSCGGTIINNRSIMTTASCFDYLLPSNVRCRVGSSYASSGGFVHEIAQLALNPAYDRFSNNNDIAIIRIPSAFALGPNVQAAAIGGPAYVLGDGVAVTAIGWGETSYGGPLSEQLRQVQIWTVNQQVCRSNYNIISMTITENMMCAGWLGVGGKDVCARDYGGPLLHNNVVVGIASLGTACGYANYPGVYTRVSNHTDWIQANA